MLKIYEIDGERFSNLEEFFDEISRVLVPGAYWGRNMDAFNDILRGGFGTPDNGFKLIWKNHCTSRERLSYEETTRQWEAALTYCHPLNISSVQEKIGRARADQGPTLFDDIVNVIRKHGVGGTESEDGVELILD